MAAEAPPNESRLACGSARGAVGGFAPLLGVGRGVIIGVAGDATAGEPAQISRLGVKEKFFHQCSFSSLLASSLAYYFNEV